MYKMSSELRYVKTSERAGDLAHASAGAAGLDLKSAEEAVIPPGGRVSVSTDLIICLPPGTYGRISSRSGLAFKHGVEAFAGVIDNDYRGIVRVLLRNFGASNYKIRRGDRIAQMVVQPYLNLQCRLKSIDLSFLDATERNDQGFGSTGV
ncbi:dUTPase [Lymantria xylina nucleopolyhedrovirus]|uniref:dUTP diphosphatase n=1 Tax=Lymantria xylina multiple nucleopolyhedrovirus TaxID=2847840 RepID=D4N2H8_9ABAC|nr:dUTPase [Lymantria xylina nucleopolyhedrovirus]ADD73850.1 dUTPase [Lymantria xylina nucleopolyhedrovirus]